MPKDKLSTGRIIMFEGPDAVGKGTMLQYAAETLTDKGYQVHTTRVHGGTPIGEKLREVSLSQVPRKPLTDIYISKAMHAELSAELAERKQQGFVCLVDRSPLSMWAYQVAASGLEQETALPLIQDSMRLLNPDDVLVYLAPLPVLKERLAKRSDAGDYFQGKPDAYWQRVIDAYEHADELFRIIRIDARQSIKEMQNDTMQAVDNCLKR